MQLVLGGLQDGFVVKPDDDRYNRMLKIAEKIHMYFVCNKCKTINCYDSLYWWSETGKQTCVHCNTFHRNLK
jgi:hypothetical protein